MLLLLWLFIMINIASSGRWSGGYGSELKTLVDGKIKL
jgi:hypothetical protein